MTPTTTAKRKRLTVDELLRLACIYAEQDREAYLSAWSGVNDDSARAIREETKAFLSQLRAYRIKRWGKSWRDKLNESTGTVDAFTLKRRPK